MDYTQFTMIIAKKIQHLKKPWSQEVVWLLARVPRWEFSALGRSGRAGRSRNRPEMVGTGEHIRCSTDNHLEERPPVHHLGKDGPDWPDVDGAGVLGGTKEHLGSSEKKFDIFNTLILSYSWQISPVPQRDHLVCVDPHWDSESPGFEQNSSAPREKLVDYLANPKSAILIAPFLSIKRFWGLRSLQLSLG